MPSPAEFRVLVVDRETDVGDLLQETDGAGDATGAGADYQHADGAGGID